MCSHPSADDAADPLLSQRPSARLESFRWTRAETDSMQLEARYLNQLVGRVIDVSHGVRVVLEMLEHDVCAELDDDHPLLDETRRSALRRLSISSLQLLDENASRLADWIAERHDASLRCSP